MKYIDLPNGEQAMVDDEDFPYLSRFSWCVVGDGDARSVAVGLSPDTNRVRTTLYMTQLLIASKKGFFVYHQDNNPLNNQKKNLVHLSNNYRRHATPVHSEKKTSRFKGVHWYAATEKWRAQISHGHEKMHLGAFTNEVDAARAYNERARELYGESAYQNEI